MTSDGDSLESRAAGARRFRDKVCVIAGAGQGIGSAAARRLAQEGGMLILGDWVEDSVRRVSEQIEASGGQAAVHTGDYSTWDAAQSLMEHAMTTYGRIDVLVVVVGGYTCASYFLARRRNSALTSSCGMASEIHPYCRPP